MYMYHFVFILFDCSVLGLDFLSNLHVHVASVVYTCTCIFMYTCTCTCTCVWIKHLKYDTCTCIYVILEV